MSDVPQKVNTKARYLFYISGYIVEAGNTRPTSPKFGVYEYERILETFERSGFVVISEARKQSTEIESYAAKVADQVRQLLKAGVPPEHMTVVGASQGSWIAMLVSTYVANRAVNFVFIAACAADDGFLKSVDLHGNVLFISERTDLPGSCERFRSDATGLGNYKEVELNTGLKHGFLYRPLKEWIKPTIAWTRAHSIVDATDTLNPPVKEPALRRELLKRVEQDQAIRNELISKGVENPDKAILARMQAIDTANTERMRVIVHQYGWPGPELVGRDGSEAAFLLVQHADHAFQKEMLPLVEKAYRIGGLSGQSYASLLDRVLVGEGKPQVYGTQAKRFEDWKGQEPVLAPIQDEANVDKRRAEVGLPPLSEYREMLKRMYFPQSQ